MLDEVRKSCAFFPEQYVQKGRKKGRRIVPVPETGDHKMILGTISTGRRGCHLGKQITLRKLKRRSRKLKLVIFTGEDPSYLFR